MYKTVNKKNKKDELFISTIYTFKNIDQGQITLTEPFFVVNVTCYLYWNRKQNTKKLEIR